MSVPSRFGRYAVKRLLGEGEMGTVYLAEDPEIGRLVAIKTFRDPADDGSAEATESRERFEREIRVTGTFDHANIVTIHDVGLVERSGAGSGAPSSRQRFVAMEYVDGCSLAELLGREGTLHLDHVAELTGQVAGALDYAHARDIVHRDVKPANILLNSSGVAKITDFGVARLVGSTLTRHGTTYGSPAYMSPEQASGQPVTGTSDQFSLAVIVYQMLTGERPFAGESVSSVIFRILNEDPVPPELLNPLVPEEVGAPVLTALAKNPTDRHPDCETFSEALRDAARAGGKSTRTVVSAGAGSAGAGSAGPGSTGPGSIGPKDTPTPGSLPKTVPTPTATRTAHEPAGAGGARATVTRAVASTSAWIRSRPRMALGIAFAAVLVGGYWLLGGARSDGTSGGTEPAKAESRLATSGGSGQQQSGLVSGTDRGDAGGDDGGWTIGREGTLSGKLAERAANAAAILDDGLTDAERGIPRWLAARARCVAVVPGVKKVGFGLGGRYGRGLVSCRTGSGWSRPSFAAIRGGSFGLQIGAQSTDLVLVFTNDRAAEHLLDDEFTLGGDASVAAGPVGRSGEVGTDVKLEAEIYSYSRNRGLFAGISVEGARLSTDTEANEVAYGRGVAVRDLLFRRGGTLPPELATFLDRLDDRHP